MSKHPATVLKHLLLLVLSFIAVFPLYWMTVSSLKGAGEIFNSLLFPATPTPENYRYAFSEMPILRMICNSVIISGTATVCQMLTTLFAAYALVRWEFKGKTLIYLFITLTWLIPFQAIMVPNYVLINQMHLNGSLVAIILPNIASAFGVISLYQAFNSFPKALIEAARMDGSKELQILKDIVFPPMKASIMSLTILLFINSWNDYMWPRLVTKELAQAPIQIGLRAFISSDTNLWGTLMAATTISCIPIFVIYLFLQRHIVDAFMRWGIK